MVGAQPPWPNKLSGHLCLLYDTRVHRCVELVHMEKSHLFLILQKNVKPYPEHPPHHLTRASPPSSPYPQPEPGWGSFHTQVPGLTCSPVCVFTFVGTPGPVCVCGSHRWAAPLSAPTHLLCRPKMRGTTTSSTSCWLGCLPNSGRPSAYRRLRPTTT